MRLQQLSDELAALLGAGNVISDPDQLAAAAQTNYPVSQQIPLILRPGAATELAECLKIARRYNQPVYVISRGKNWGYGSRVPVHDTCVLIELDRMNRILDYDSQLGYITVEPGVTFQQAFDFLREQKSELLLGTTGGPIDSSLIGNALERGIGTGVYADRFSAVCGMEVVLPDGNIIQTGFERFPGNTTGKLSRWGMGPSLDGLFSQSNLGIVTRMTVWLTKCPAFFQIGFYKTDSIGKFTQLIDRLQAMAMEGLIKPAITLYNDMRIISALTQFPFHETEPGALDPDVLMAQIRETSPVGAMVGPWNGEISIRAVSEEHALIQSRMIEERIKDLVYDLSFISATREDIITTLDAHYARGGKTEEPVTLRSFLLNKYIGIPGNAAIGYAYWRKRKPVPKVMDPDRDGCGMLWLSPAVPFRGEDVAKAVRIIKSVAKDYRLEAAVSLQCTSERSIQIISSIAWDREVPGEDENAVACYHEANRQLKAAGYYAYRNATLGMQDDNAENAYDRLLQQLKDAVDPGHILSPGKYIPSLRPYVHS